MSEDDMPTEGGDVWCGIVAEWTAQRLGVAIERGVQSIQDQVVMGIGLGV